MDLLEVNVFASPPCLRQVVIVLLIIFKFGFKEDQQRQDVD